MSRPLKTEAERRTALLQFRLTPTEHRRLSRRAEIQSQSLSDYSRAVLLGTQILGTHAEAPPAATNAATLDPQILHHLIRLGNNLNQIARHLNTNPPPGGLRSLAMPPELPSLCQQIEQLVIEARDGSKGRG